MKKLLCYLLFFSCTMLQLNAQISAGGTPVSFLYPNVSLNQPEALKMPAFDLEALRAEDFDNDRKDAGELGAGHSVTALYEIILHSNTSTNLKAADSLKNKPTKGRYTQPSGDLLTVKLRYKLPTDSTSLLIEKPLGRVGLLKEMSNNFKWASGVAAYALCLRNSQFKGTATFEGILKNAQNALTFDPNGYRKDFIELVRQTMAIPKP